MLPVSCKIYLRHCLTKNDFFGTQKNESNRFLDPDYNPVYQIILLHHIFEKFVVNIAKKFILMYFVISQIAKY